MKYITLILAVAFCTASCNDWLDVRPDTEQKDYDQFSSVGGFFDALTGCYVTMAGDDLYGQRLTMSNIEALANLWEVKDNTSRYEELELSGHDYSKDHAREAIARIYDGLFNVIAQANMVIKYIDEKGDVFTDESMRKMVEGEAYAIRAYCQLDVLRLFGQMPQNARKQVELPYSFTTSIYEMPVYYSFSDYVELLKKDVAKALELLKDNDPVFEYTFEELNSGNAGVADNHQNFRQSRLNYWAVKALEARMLLYIGDKQGAYAAAKAVIDGKGADGSAVMKMSGVADMAAGYMAYPHECLFYMSKYNLLDKATKLLIGGSRGQVSRSRLAISLERYNDLYADMPATYLASHNRYRSGWGTCETPEHDPYRSVLKYWWNADSETSAVLGNASSDRLYRQVIPMLRMSEVYLIAMETANLSEANTLFRTYMEDRAVAPSLVSDFASGDDVRTFLLNEYRREFYAEGQMFYTYKRRGEASIKWYAGTVSDDTYVLPLPETEFNPNL